jgi:hypothetical protein
MLRDLGLHVAASPLECAGQQKIFLYRLIYDVVSSDYMMLSGNMTDE